MTTNERMNLSRYAHFHTGRRGSYDSPFDRGMWQNLVDFAQFRCFGYLRPMREDWTDKFDLDQSVNEMNHCHSRRKQGDLDDNCCNVDNDEDDKEPLLTVV